MEGSLFYFFFWAYWILVTFFMKREKTQKKLSIGLLICIALSLQKINIANIEISIVSLFLLFAAYYLTAKEQGNIQIYLLVTTFIVMLSYSAFQLFALYDPVWVIFNKKLMAAVLIAYLTVILHGSFILRTISLTIGLIQGDILYSFIVGKLTSHIVIGSFEFFDMFSLSIAFVSMVSVLKKMIFYFETHYQYLEKEKQKRL